MGKKKQKHGQAAKASNREASADMQQPSQVAARSESEAKATASSSNLDTTDQQARAYVTLEQLAVMEPNTKVNVEMPHLPGGKFTLYTIAANMVIGVQCIAADEKTMGRKVILHMYKMMVQQAKQEDPADLFHKMNSGTETDLLRWQQFSGLCFNIIFMQHVLHGVKFRAWVDADDLPPGKRAAQERARSTKLTGDMKSSSLLKSDPASTIKVSKEPAPILTEFGDDDIVHLDMRQLIGRSIGIQAPRNAVQDIFAYWHKYMVNPGAPEMAKRIYNQLLNDLKSDNLPTHEPTVADSCVELAVLARLLYNKPICVEKAAVPETPKLFGEPCTDGSHVGAFITNPTTEMLHTITIPTAVADKGGYIIAGYFRPVMGIETLHLKFSDFKQDDDIILSLRNEGDKYMLMSRMPNKSFISQLISWKKIKGANRAMMKEIDEKIHTLCDLPDNTTFVDQILTNDPAAQRQLAKVIQDRNIIPFIRQALNGTPARLFYSSNHSHGGDDPKRIAYLQRVRKLCIKKLNESTGVYFIHV